MPVRSRQTSRRPVVILMLAMRRLQPKPLRCEFVSATPKGFQCHWCRRDGSHCKFWPDDLAILQRQVTQSVAGGGAAISPARQIIGAYDGIYRPNPSAGFNSLLGPPSSGMTTQQFTARVQQTQNFHPPGQSYGGQGNTINRVAHRQPPSNPSATRTAPPTEGDQAFFQRQIEEW